MASYRSFGLFGLVLLSFGLLGGLITFQWTSLYVLVHLLGGGALITLYLFTHLESLKESVAGRRAQYGTNTIVYSLITLAVIGLVNFVGVQHPWRYDATETGRFSLAPQSRQILQQLEQDVEVTAFFREGEDQQVRNLLDSYAYVTDRFRYQMVDPDRRPELAEEMEVTQYGTIVVRSGEQNTRVNETTEEALTNAIIRVTGGQKKRIYYSVGHGEPDLETSDDPAGFGLLKAALENEGYEIEPLLLGTVPDVPADADLLLVAGPQRPFLEHELAVVDRYLDRGGSAVILLDPRAGDDLVPVLERRGIRVGDDVVVDQVIRLFAGPALGVDPIVSDYGAHAVTQEFGQRTIYHLARSVEPADESPEGVSVSTLARTSESSWAEGDVERLFAASEAGLDDDDRVGPVSIAVAATLREPALAWTPPQIATAPDAGGDDTTGADGPAVAADQEGAEAAPPEDLEGRLVVFGDSDWVSNQYLGLYFNQDLFLNAVGWLAGEEELISIRPRRTRASRVVLTEAESWAVFYSSVLLLPELVLIAGLAIWWRRRR